MSEMPTYAELESALASERAAREAAERERDVRPDWREQERQIAIASHNYSVRALAAEVTIAQILDLGTQDDNEGDTFVLWNDVTRVAEKADPSALARHDAEVKATALEEAAVAYQADGYVTGEHTPGFFGVGDWEGEPDEWLRARAAEIRKEAGE